MATTTAQSTAESSGQTNTQSPARQTLKRMFGNTSVRVGGTIALLILLMGVFAPFLGTRDPADISPRNRNKAPGYEAMVRDYDGNKIPVVYRMGSDTLGRDVYSRVVYGARISLLVGASVTAAELQTWAGSPVERPPLPVK